MTPWTLQHCNTNYFCFVWILSISCVSFASSVSSVFTEEKVSQLATELISDCDPSVCHSDELLQLITHGSSSQYDQILHILNEKRPLCLRFVIEAVRDYLNKYNKTPVNCENLTGEKKQNCQSMHAEYAVVSERILSLVNLLVSNNPHLIRPFNRYLSENKMSLSHINTGLLSLLQGLKDERSCSEYEIGEERQFIITPFQSTILPYTYYRIRRESEKHYKAFVTLEFSLDPFYDGPLPVSTVDQVHDYYMGNIGSCMNQVNPKMKGPNGETLEIVIEDARQVNSCRTKQLIEIGFYDQPATAKYYYIYMKCLHTTHEIAHLLGLWDEYSSENHQCRVVQDNSLLSSERTYLDRVFAKKLDDSLLAPSHFQSILYGDCSLRDDVRLYRRCSRLSYQVLSSENACLDEKAYCDRQNVLGRDKIAEQQRISKEIQDLQTDLNAIDIQLSNDPLPRSHPEYPQDESKRSKALREQQEAQDRISDLQRRLELVLSWPDLPASSP